MRNFCAVFLSYRREGFEVESAEIERSAEKGKGRGRRRERMKILIKR
jgi:hypothetical protein